MTDLLRAALVAREGDRPPDVGDLVLARGRGLCLIERVLLDPNAAVGSPIRVRILVTRLRKPTEEPELLRPADIWGWWPNHGTGRWEELIEQLEAEQVEAEAIAEVADAVDEAESRG